MNTEKIKIKDVYFDKAMKAIEGIVPEDEPILLELKGAFKEYLICTEKMVYIVKKGFMTGHTFGNGAFHLPYSSITNAEVNMHFASGYFELSGAGLENKQLSYWSNNKKDSAQQQPNVISLTSRANANDFREAAQFIMQRKSELESAPAVAPVSAADEILKFKTLLDQGILTQEEFDAKKKQLLGL